MPEEMHKFLLWCFGSLKKIILTNSELLDGIEDLDLIFAHMNLLMLIIQIRFNSSDQMSSQMLELAERQHLKQGSKSFQQADKIDEEQHTLIPQTNNQPIAEEQVKPKQHQRQVEDAIDPIEQLIKNNNVAPLLAVLHMIDLSIQVESKPLLSKLCTMNIPLALHLKGRQILFDTDADNRTALHEAIAADDTCAVNWCFQNGIGNVKDNFGNSPIIEAIKLGRRSSFLLCLHYQFYDSQAPHVCASYNRTWQLKILHRMGYDVTSIRDSEHFSPLERAVANYSYEAAEYLTEITDKVSTGYLATKTDSKGIIRTIEKANKNRSLLNKTLPYFFPIFNLLIVYYFLTQLQLYSTYSSYFEAALITLVVLYALMHTVGRIMNSQLPFSIRNVNLMALLDAPQFPILQDICPECITIQNPRKDHCRKCEKCVQNFHFHDITCVNKNNEIFWLLIEIFWFFIIYHLHQILISQLKLQNLLILNLSSNFFFRNAVILDQLYKSDRILLSWFIYLKIFLLYQFFCCFQWLCMLVLDRTYRQINNTQKYKRLYRVVKTTEGGYKNQQIKLMENGLCKAIFSGLLNVCKYFFR